jgi:hypothetical protein
MEKHLSKIIGYAEEVAAGKEGDEKELLEFAEQMRKARELDVQLKKKDIPGAFEQIGELARQWRRKLQGAENHTHADTIETHKVKCSGANCGK